jgi:hypothetical protein
MLNYSRLEECLGLTNTLAYCINGKIIRVKCIIVPATFGLIEDEFDIGRNCDQ